MSIKIKYIFHKLNGVIETDKVGFFKDIAFMFFVYW